MRSNTRKSRSGHITHLIKTTVALLMLACTAVAFAAMPINTLKKGFINDTPTGVAINGYDTVAYFTDKKPVKGSDQNTYQWQGGTWKFASKEHLELFKANPEKYAPQFGGYCAYGVAQGYLVSVEPDQFTIIDDKLYLNYDASVQSKWKKDPAGFNKTANAKFSDLLKK